MVAAGVSPDLAKWNPLVAVVERVEEGNDGGAEGEGVIRLGPELRRPVVILRRGGVELDAEAYQNLLGGGQGASPRSLLEAEYACLIVVDFCCAAACQAACRRRSRWRGDSPAAVAERW